MFDLCVTFVTSGDRYRLGGGPAGVPPADEVQIVQMVPGQRAATEVHSRRECASLRTGELEAESIRPLCGTFSKTIRSERKCDGSQLVLMQIIPAPHVSKSVLISLSCFDQTAIFQCVSSLL